MSLSLRVLQNQFSHERRTRRPLSFTGSAMRCASKYNTDSCRLNRSEPCPVNDLLYPLGVRLVKRVFHNEPARTVRNENQRTSPGLPSF